MSKIERIIERGVRQAKAELWTWDNPYAHEIKLPTFYQVIEKYFEIQAKYKYAVRQKQYSNIGYYGTWLSYVKGSLRDRIKLLELRNEILEIAGRKNIDRKTMLKIAKNNHVYLTLYFNPRDYVVFICRIISGKISSLRDFQLKRFIILLKDY